MSTALIFLQNAWSPVYAGREWPRESWMRALEQSRSGKMLKILTADLTQVWNTTPQVAPRANGICKPDYRYVSDTLDALRPTAVVACGTQAITVIREIWPNARLELPHPACRWLKSDLYREGKRLLDLMTIGNMHFRARVWQQKGEPIKVEVLQK